MVGFYIYETETFQIKLNKDNVLNDIKHIIVSISQPAREVQVDKKDNEIGIDEENNIISVSFSQEETAKFKPGNAEIQVNIYYNNSERDVSSKGQIEVRDNLYKKVISDGNN